MLHNDEKIPFILPHVNFAPSPKLDYGSKFKLFTILLLSVSDPSRIRIQLAPGSGSVFGIRIKNRVPKD
jgi:hypothetical protein